MGKLDIVIVSYNAGPYLLQCLGSVYAALGGIDAKVFVVDNASADGGADEAETLFPSTIVIRNKGNLGFSKANNIAISQSSGEYVLLLNPDTIIGPHTLERCVRFMDSTPEAGAVGVRMVDTAGKVWKESRRGLPGVWASVCKMAGLAGAFPNSRFFARYYMSWLPWDSPQTMEVASGAFCLLRREALGKAGLLDERFFMYGEDIDLCHRVLKAGYSVWYLPETILHYKGESTDTISAGYVKTFNNAMRLYYEKHYSHHGRAALAAVKAAVGVRTAVGKSRVFLKKLIAKNQSEATSVIVPTMIDGFNLSLCREIAETNGLAVSPDVGCVKPGGKAVAVLDSSAMTYGEILETISANRAGNVSYGILHPGQRRIITAGKVWQIGGE